MLSVFYLQGAFLGRFRMSPLYAMTSWSFSLGCSSPSPLQANPASQAVIHLEWPRRAKISSNEEVATGSHCLGAETFPLGEMQS